MQNLIKIYFEVQDSYSDYSAHQNIVQYMVLLNSQTFTSYGNWKSSSKDFKKN